MKYSIALILFVSLCVGCANNRTKGVAHFQPVDIKTLQPLVVEFTTSISSAKKVVSVNRWRLMRTVDQVELLNLTNKTSELWSKTSNDLWFYSKIFHDDRQVVEYSPVDLNLLGVKYQWQSLALIIDPEILSALTENKKAKPFYGWNRVVYSGKVANTHYEVHWLPELSIAGRVKITDGDAMQLTELGQPVVGESSWPLSDISRYRIIEYTDLGDMERDPFVLKIQHQLIEHHGHSH